MNTHPGNSVAASEHRWQPPGCSVLLLERKSKLLNVLLIGNTELCLTPVWEG